jgi:4-amino-4-deoxy-L-arabinose transferase-like glycosyltransferase
MIGINFLRNQCYCLHLPYSTVNRAPLWPLILGLFSFVFGTHDLPVRLFLCVLDATICLMIYLFAGKLFNQRLAVIAGIIAAFYPGLFVYTGWLYSEMLYTFLLFMLSYILYLYHHQRRTAYMLISGILLGLLGLTRPNGLLVCVPFLAWLCALAGRNLTSWKTTLQHGSIVIAITLVMITPWAIRNYTVTQSFVPIASGDGTVLLGSYNDQVAAQPWSQITWINPLRATPAIAKAFPAIACNAHCEITRENTYKQAAIAWIKAHISLMPMILTSHFLNMWTPSIHEADLPADRFPTQYSTYVVSAMMQTIPIPIFLFALWGGIIMRRLWRQLLFIYLNIFITIGQNIVFYGIARFRAPIEPWLILLAVGGGWHLWQKFRGTQHNVSVS